MTCLSNLRPFALAGAASICLLGCGRVDDWFPLYQGKQWRYLSRQSGGVISLSVAGRARVGTRTGWRIASDGGDSRLIWNAGELQASVLTACKFEPPITILKPANPKSKWPWEGVMISRSKPGKATATITQAPTKLRFGSIERETLRVTIAMRWGSSNIEQTTWYERGTGVIQQEQRIDGELVASLVLSGER